MHALPPHFVTREEAGTITICRASHEDVLSCFARARTWAGRGRPVREEGLVHKRYFRGGWVRFLGDRYRSWARLRREIEIAEHLRSAGVGAPEILAARAMKDGWGWYRLEIVSREIPRAAQWTEFLRRGTDRHRTLRAVAAAVRRFHDAGVRHGDLTVDNILVADGAVYFVDFDSARRVEMSDALRLRELRRLLRSARKRGLPVSRTDLLRFTRVYAERDPLLFRELGFENGNLSR